MTDDMPQEAREHASTSIIDNISGPEVGFKQERPLQIDRPTLKNPARRHPTRLFGKSFEELNAAENARQKREREETIEIDMVNQSFEDPLGILEEYTKAKDKVTVAHEVVDVFSNFKAKVRCCCFSSRRVKLFENSSDWLVSAHAHRRNNDAKIKRLRKR